MLYVVPTPIGNLEDITLRAIRILKEVDAVVAEDTRTSGILLKHYSISKPLISFHKFNEHKIVTSLIDKMLQGETLALISDAGTPGISDPGFLLVREAISNDIQVVTLPGATAMIPAVVSSGLPCDKFVFEGFLPQKKGRNKLVEMLKSEQRTMIFYESPNRLVKSLELFKEAFGEDRKAAVCREISKLHEEIKRGTLSELIEYFSENAPRGEIVIVVGGAK
ncbi:MAG: 16S rRNA (cytidine(1402)-2'-O)-methyltransferase [Salinivirgaceae bacterium]|jgi:16S rRNA (cytidine1402-2'-O)-methyltransferase|nr:16S rRNA (cytidine(1402)-2'-O)-methyltransferase [Bacteroidales bacterium]